MTSYWWFGACVLMFITGYIIGQKIRWVRSIEQAS